ncbi:putative thioredoxin-like protein [Medicago truncatula]|uniref:Putative thioredoxin-like protein n=1 Tax=Medicago truncatula TaxID=3880 RepID=G7LIP5_MEDTR|nr:thioredoxin-like fold domain-containing protein MRL7 homolog, chloroplastic [Medicago truncatula]AET04220.1 thioredoxin family protein, putative [Medicago truncatula]RHN42626.1 putative thioredoxin-like protein [Medicago truncatula]
MLILQTALMPRTFSPFSHSRFLSYSTLSTHHIVKPISISCSVSTNSSSKPEPEPNHPTSKQRPKNKGKIFQSGDGVSINKDDRNSEDEFPTTIPRKPRRGRKSEAMKVEDFVRDRLENTFAAIRQQNASALENHKDIMKDSVGDDCESKPKRGNDDSYEEEVEEEEDGGGEKAVIEEESESWPLDTDVGWGIRASEYFEKHPIKNVVGDDGAEIDWEGETEDNWVQEINCLEWESFAFHPSPLIVLVFERYNRANDNWKNLKELEKAIKVYWSAKDRLPPRAIKIDINIEKDLAYALKVRECPQILFLRGNKMVYREKELRTADELVQMIAFFYYNAKKPAWVDDKALYLRH